MRKLTILIDMDGITADLTGKMLSIFNSLNGTQYGQEHIIDWGFEKCFPGGKVLYRYMDEPGFFRDLAPIPGCIESLKRLHAYGHELHIVTTPHLKGTCAHDKLAWVQEHLPFIGAKNTILARDKTLVRGDVLIDDKPETIRNYRAVWPESFLTSIEYPYNRDCTDSLNVLAKSCHDFEQAWDDMTEGILNFAYGRRATG